MVDVPCESVYWLAAAFGVSSWVTINGIFAELPLIISSLPEGWALASTLGLAIQVANIGPILYRLCRPSFRTIPGVVFLLLAVGMVSMALLAAFWNAAAEVFGQQRSLAMILLTFTAALCDCTSSLVYWPFVVQLPEAQGVPGLALGESLSGASASLLAWLQVALGLPPSCYFSALALTLLGSGIAFSALLRRLASGKREAALSGTELDYRDEDQAPPEYVSLQREYTSMLLQPPHLCYFAVGWVSFLENGVLPALLPYAVAKYSTTVYFLSSTIPVGAMAVLALVYTKASLQGILVLLMLLTVSNGYIVWLSFQASWVPLGNGVGAVMAALAVFSSKALLAYTKSASMFRLKVEADSSEVAKSRLETAGIMMQVWSLTGALLMFWLVNYTSVLPKQ